MLEPLDEERRAELLGILRSAFDAYGDQGGAVVAGLLRRLAGRDLDKVWNLRSYCKPAIEQVAAEVSREALAERRRELEERQRLEAAQQAQAQAERRRSEEQADRAALRRAFEALSADVQVELVAEAKERMTPLVRDAVEKVGGGRWDGMLGIHLERVVRERRRDGAR